VAFVNLDFEFREKLANAHPEIVPHEQEAAKPGSVTLTQTFDQQLARVPSMCAQPLLELIENNKELVAFMKVLTQSQSTHDVVKFHRGIDRLDMAVDLPHQSAFGVASGAIEVDGEDARRELR
jgi:hypothetical protein